MKSCFRNNAASVADGLWRSLLVQSSRLIIVLVVFALSGCRTTELKQLEPEDPGNLHRGDSSMRASLVLLADAQFNENHGSPTSWQTFAAQHYIEMVARRSVQQTVYADALLGETLRVAERRDPGAPVVFLGDAANYSCAPEYERFLRVMNASGADWIALPGNHDGFYSGITEPDHKFEVHSPLSVDYGRDEMVWQDVCGATSNGDHPPQAKMPKSNGVDGFIERYLSSLMQRHGGAKLGPIDSMGCSSAHWSSGLLREAHWCPADKERPPYEAFLSQRLEVVEGSSTIEIVLLDSSVYAEPPCVLELDRSCRDAGQHGGLGPVQQRLAEEWLRIAKAAGHAVVLMAHHPIAIWAPDDVRWLKERAAEREVALVVSAHTHNGCVRMPFVVDAPTFRELNVNSIIDNPMGYTRLWLHGSPRSLTADFENVPLVAETFGHEKLECSVPDDRSRDSIRSQSQHINTGSYLSQLIQIDAELSLYLRQLDGTAAAEARKKQAAVEDAILLDERMCVHWYAFGAIDIGCERPLVRATAQDAQWWLDQQEKNGVIDQADPSLLACRAAAAAPLYWAAASGSGVDRPPEKECYRSLYPEESTSHH